MTDFTPGPWKIDASGNIFGQNARPICSANGSMSNLKREAWQAENDANASLIAAAPEMYEALLSILSGDIAPGLSCDKIHAAIRKANRG